MQLNTLLDTYQGQLLDEQDLSFYERWAMDYFHDDQLVSDPYLSITLDLPLAKARETYQRYYQSAEGASFQGFLIWCLAKALKSEWIFSTRNINGKWYRFDNLPIFCPIAVGGDLRFKDVILENVTSLSWSEFARYYRQSVDCNDAKLEVLSQEVWALCPFIGNLPNMAFSSFQIHRNKLKTGRPLFYFGQRKIINGEPFVPLSISFDHANSDPFVLDKLLARFKTLATSVSE
ncbi:hypothetical protein [Pseudoalteromonas piratica]|uniref:Chloramphenicol acetyltransferase n=1 Tax=Pseudoalteromonas piratica TaxID=1348114 RepID=A0A0A7ELT5_9GAMM|nr:hypothetical protein [Pseudoalteromonas piratica]AIY67589.1 hypothetical protein OM33_21590 [Pseudoalteromonas piratica]